MAKTIEDIVMKNTQNKDLINSDILPEEISVAFREFNEQSLLLTQAYEALKADISRINLELEHKNRVLKEKNIELDAARDFLDSLFRGMGEGLLVLSEDGTILMLNKRAADILELASSIAGESITAINELSFISDYLKNPAFNDFRNRAYKIKKDNRTLWLEVSLNKINNGREILLVFKDLTEVKDLRAQVARSAELADLGQMAVTVAHEIRNPLGGIEGFASLLKRDLENDSDKLRLIDRIISGVQNLNSFVSGLLSFSKELKVNSRVTNINDFIDKALMYAGKFEGNDRFPDIDILKDITGKINWKTDADLLHKLFLNLLLNSFQVMDGNKGVVSIKVSECEYTDNSVSPLIYSYQSMDFTMNKSYLRLEIADSGPGIDPKDVDNIFKPFFTTKNFGTGIGLSLVIKITEALEGRLELTGRSDTGGAKFVIYLPELSDTINDSGDGE